MFCKLHVVMADDHYNLTLVVKSASLIEVDADGVLEDLLPKVITNLKTRKRKFCTFLFSFSSNADESISWRPGGLDYNFFLTMGFLEVLSCGCILQFVNFVRSSKDHFDVVSFCSRMGFHASLEMWILADR
jgi:hypothetical protein